MDFDTQKTEVTSLFHNGTLANEVRSLHSSIGQIRVSPYNGLKLWKGSLSDLVRNREKEFGSFLYLFALREELSCKVRS